MEPQESPDVEFPASRARLKSRKWRPNLRSAKCEWCGKKFRASRRWQRFDTERCRKAAHQALVEKALQDWRKRHRG